jgi:divalent metal cation (Fe/Co/Zn/Cd) transporter
VERIVDILDRYAADGVRYHALRTRQAGAQRFMSVHVQVPGAWSVQDGHSLLEDIDRDVRAALEPISVFTHLEPLEDPRSWDDIAINRTR